MDFGDGSPAESGAEGVHRYAVCGRYAVTVTTTDASGCRDSVVRWVRVEVADDGPGIAHDIRERIFNPFFSTKPQGSGLGLAIVRKIVDAHEGRIDVASDVGRGTVFTVTLPVVSPGRVAFGQREVRWVEF